MNINNFAPIPLEEALEYLGLEIDLDDLSDYASSDAAVADIEEVEFVDDGDTYDALAVNFFSEGVADLTLYVDEGGEEDATYTFSVAVALRDEQDVPGTNEPTPPPTEPEEPEQPGDDVSEWNGYYTIARPYTGAVKPEDIGFSVEVGSYRDYTFDGECRGEINRCVSTYDASTLFEYTCYFTRFTLNGDRFTLSDKYSDEAAFNFPTGMEGVQIMPFQNVVAADQDLSALHFNNIEFRDGALYFTYNDRYCYGLQERYYYTEYEDDYEYYGWIKDHNLYTNRHDGIDLKMIYGYFIVDAQGNYGYVVTDESEPVHFEIKNLQPDPLSVYFSYYNLAVSIGTDARETADTILRYMSLSNADNGPYTLYLGGTVNTTDVSGLYKDEDFWGYYNGSYQRGIPAYRLPVSQLYLKDGDGRIVWTYSKVSEEIPCYAESSDSTYFLYLIDPKDAPDDEDEERIEAYFRFGTDGKDEYGQQLTGGSFLLSEDKTLIAEYNTHKVSMGGVNVMAKAKRDDAYMLGLVDDDTLIDYLKDHVYVYEKTPDGEYSLSKLAPDRVELNEEESRGYPVEWDEMEEPSDYSQLYFDLYDEQGKVIGYAEAYAMALKPVSMMSVSLDMNDGAGSGAHTRAETYYISGMEEPESYSTEPLKSYTGVQNSAAGQLIAFLKNEYDWQKYFSEGIPGEAFYASIEVSYINGLLNIGGGLKAGGGGMSCLAGVQLSNKLNVSGKYDKNGKPIADKVSVTETHELPVRLSASFNPNVSGVYRIGIVPMPDNKAAGDMAVSVKAIVSPAPARDVSFGGAAGDLTVYPAQVDTPEKLTALLDTVKAYNENGALIVPTMVITNGEGTTFTPAELLADLAEGKTYTVTYTATHKKDPTIAKTVQRTLTVEAATVTFTGIAAPLTVPAGRIGDLMMALREGVSAKDNDGASVDFAVSLPEGFTGAAGEYTVTYTAIQPVTGERMEKSRKLIAAEGTASRTAPSTMWCPKAARRT